MDTYCWKILLKQRNFLTIYFLSVDPALKSALLTQISTRDNIFIIRSPIVFYSTLSSQLQSLDFLL